MPHPAFVAAVVAGSVALLGISVYKMIKEQENFSYFQSQEPFRSMFRHSNDFDFQDDEDSFTEKHPMEDDDNRSSTDDNSQLRSRKPFSYEDSSDMINGDKKKYLEKERYELSVLESNNAERRKQILAEEAFLDDLEENNKKRRNEIEENEQHTTGSSHTESSNDATKEESKCSDNHFTVFNQFTEEEEENEDEEERSPSSASCDNTENPFYSVDDEDHNDDALSLLNDASQTTKEEEIEQSDHADYMSQLSNESQVTIESENNILRPVSDSEGSWDAVSEDEWNYSVDNNSDSWNRPESIYSLSDQASIASSTEDGYIS